MAKQVDGVLMCDMSGTELSPVRTEFRLLPLGRINHGLLESRGPTLLCSQVESNQKQMSGNATHRELPRIDRSEPERKDNSNHLLSFGRSMMRGIQVRRP
jgi:hypothetical protein